MIKYFLKILKPCGCPGPDEAADVRDAAVEAGGLLHDVWLWVQGGEPVLTLAGGPGTAPQPRHCHLQQQQQDVATQITLRWAEPHWNNRMPRTHVRDLRDGVPLLFMGLANAMGMGALTFGNYHHISITQWFIIHHSSYWYSIPISDHSGQNWIKIQQVISKWYP